jgi:hypothetical protein
MEECKKFVPKHRMKHFCENGNLRVKCIRTITKNLELHRISFLRCNILQSGVTVMILKSLTFDPSLGRGLKRITHFINGFCITEKFILGI